MRLPLTALVLTGLVSISSPATAAERTPADVRVTILSTMLSGVNTVGEWGFAALVEIDDTAILFDTGRFPDTVLNNTRAMNLDLGKVEHVVLSHNHGDHTGGLLRLRAALRADNPRAVSVAHVGKGIFLPRFAGSGRSMADLRRDYEALGGRFVVHESPVELLPGVWLTGRVPRVTNEYNVSPLARLLVDGAPVADSIPEDLSMLIETGRGPLLISGCGHAGIVNTLRHAQSMLDGADIKAALGGFHLVGASAEQLRWTAENLRESGTTEFIGAHCTGLNATASLRQILGLPESHAIVGGVGTRWTSADGIVPTILERGPLIAE